jgi:secondary thiamine-phosphate synthase enzyme
MKATTQTIQVHPQVRHSFVDLTDDLRRAIKESGVTKGCAIVFCAHTTCALLINEWEEGVLEDLRKRVEVLVPRSLLDDSELTPELAAMFPPIEMRRRVP